MSNNYTPGNRTLRTFLPPDLAAEAEELLELVEQRHRDDKHPRPFPVCMDRMCAIAGRFR